MIPGQALMVSSGYIYGFWGGMLISWTGLVAGGQMAFFLARWFGRPFAERWVTPAKLARWDGMARGKGVSFFAASLVLPVFPNDAMCYVAGLGKISPRCFLFANMLGRGIACLLASLVGAYGSRIPAWGWTTGAVLALGIGIFWFAAKRQRPDAHPAHKEDGCVPA